MHNLSESEVAHSPDKQGDVREALSDLEAEPIATVFASDAKTVIGWVYIWNSGKAAFFWTGDQAKAAFLGPVTDAHSSREGGAGIKHLVKRLNR